LKSFTHRFATIESILWDVIPEKALEHGIRDLSTAKHKLLEQMEKTSGQLNLLSYKKIA